MSFKKIPKKKQSVLRSVAVKFYLKLLHYCFVGSFAKSLEQICAKQLQTASNKSSLPEKKKKKGVFGNFARFTGKHLSQGLLFNEAASLWQHQCKNLRLSCILFQTISISLETGIFAHKKSFSEKIRKSLIKRKEGFQ